MIFSPTRFSDSKWQRSVGEYHVAILTGENFLKVQVDERHPRFQNAHIVIFRGPDRGR